MPSLGPQIARFKRGREWAAVLQFVLIVVLAVDLPLWTALPLAPAVMLVCWLVGWVDERWGVWKTEQAHRLDLYFRRHRRIEEKPQLKKHEVKTICDCHHELWGMLQGNEEALEVLQQAWDRGVAMSEKLKEYKQWRKDRKEVLRDRSDS